MWSINTTSGSFDAVNLKDGATRIANYLLGDSSEDDYPAPTVENLIYCTPDKDIDAPHKVCMAFQRRLEQVLKEARDARDEESTYHRECMRLIYDRF